MAKVRYQVTIMSAVDELQRIFRALNKRYFNGSLEDVIFTIQSDTKRRAYAWISVGKIWSDKDKKMYREINVVAEWLNRNPEDVVASVLHEMCHLYNLMNNVQDTSRGGTYHNKEFYDVAVSHGLNCEKSVSYGYAITSPTDELKEWTYENVRLGCFRFQRLALWHDGTEKKKGKDDADKDDAGRPVYGNKPKSNIIKYVCPHCGMIVRASKNLDDKIMCVECADILVRSEK